MRKLFCVRRATNAWQACVTEPAASIMMGLRRVQRLIAISVATRSKRRIPFQHFFANIIAFFRAQSFNVPLYAGRQSIHVIDDQMIRWLLCSENVFGRQIRLSHMEFRISKFER